MDTVGENGQKVCKTSLFELLMKRILQAYLKVPRQELGHKKKTKLFGKVVSI